MAETVLSSEEIDARLRDQPGWAVVEGALHREVEFADFREAFGFMAMVALAAERLDHHPDWSNSWNKVVIDVVNHAAGGITDRCFALAAEIDRALGE
jgi:4a-hydroxytetrahydrobiopterin dehydratase